MQGIVRHLSDFGQREFGGQKKNTRQGMTYYSIVTPQHNRRFRILKSLVRKFQGIQVRRTCTLHLEEEFADTFYLQNVITETIENPSELSEKIIDGKPFSLVKRKFGGKTIGTIRWVNQTLETVNEKECDQFCLIFDQYTLEIHALGVREWLVINDPQQSKIDREMGIDKYDSDDGFVEDA